MQATCLLFLGWAPELVTPDEGMKEIVCFYSMWCFFFFLQNKAVIELMFAAYSGDVSALRR